MQQRLIRRTRSQVPNRASRAPPSRSSRTRGLMSSSQVRFAQSPDRKDSCALTFAMAHC